MSKPIVPSEPTFTPAKTACKADDRSYVSGAVVEAAAYIVAAVIVAIAAWIGLWWNGN